MEEPILDKHTAMVWEQFYDVLGVVEMMIFAPWKLRVSSLSRLFGTVAVNGDGICDGNRTGLVHSNSGKRH
jgi:hypothetical protein